MGFGFDAVAARNPKIIFCSSSGYGRTGEMAGLPCTDPHMQAFSGFAALNGEEAGGERVRYYGLIDLYCGHLICEAVLAALVARRREGKPQYIEMTMLGGATSALMTRLASRLRGGPAQRIVRCVIARRTDCTRPPMARLLSPLKMIAIQVAVRLLGRAELAQDERFACRQHGSSMLRRSILSCARIFYRALRLVARCPGPRRDRVRARSFRL